MPVTPHGSGREFTLGMLVCEADPFHRSVAYRSAPKPAVRLSWVERVKPTHSGRSLRSNATTAHATKIGGS